MAADNPAAARRAGCGPGADIGLRKRIIKLIAQKLSPESKSSPRQKTAVLKGKSQLPEELPLKTISRSLVALLLLNDC